MTRMLLGLPSHVRERLATALECGVLPEAPVPAALRSLLGADEYAARVGPILDELARLGVRGRAAAAWIRAIGEAAGRPARVDLVWSGPEVPGLHARDTRRVYDELVGSAEQAVWLSTYVVVDGARAFEKLAQRMDERPGLRVTLLLNIQRRKGDTTAADDLVRRFAERFWRSEWPGSSRPRVFYDPRALDPEAPGGVLHAKAVVVDDDVVFVTSANLTEAAFERNIELGLLVRDPALALSVGTHFRALIERGMLLQLPDA